MMLMQFTGHLGADPESRFAPSGQKVTTFRVAVNVRRKGQEKTVWWRVTIFGDRFEYLMPYLKKGSFVFVLGTMNPPEIYQGRDGPQVSCDVIAEVINFISTGAKGERSTESQMGDAEMATAAAPQPSYAGAPAMPQYQGSPFTPRQTPNFGGIQQGAMSNAAATKDFSDDDIPF